MELNPPQNAGAVENQVFCGSFYLSRERGKKDGLVSDMDIDENGNAVDHYYVFSGSLDGAAGGISAL